MIVVYCGNSEIDWGWIEHSVVVWFDCIDRRCFVSGCVIL